MQYFNMYHARPFLKFLFTLSAIFIGGILLGMFLGQIIAAPFFNIPFDELIESFKGNTIIERPGFLKYNQAIQSICLFVIPAFFLHALFSLPYDRYYSFTKTPDSRTIILIIISIAATLPLINFLIEINSRIPFPAKFYEMQVAADKMVEKMLTGDTVGMLLMNLFIIAVIPAVGEELIFRGILQRVFSDWTNSKYLGIILSALLFSAFHFQVYKFIPMFLLGLYFGYLFYWTKNIWLPIAAHFINNAFSTIIYYLYSNNLIAFDGNEIGSSFPESWLSITGSVAILSLTIISIYKIEKRSS